MKKPLPSIAVLLYLILPLTSAFAYSDLKNEKRELLETKSVEIERSNNFWKYLINTRKVNIFDPYLPLTGGTLTGHVTMGGGLNGNTDYGYSTLELREANFGLSSATPPRLSFHWGNVVASQIGIEGSGRIAILNNLGTGYENLIAKNITGASANFNGQIQASSDVSIDNTFGFYFNSSDKNYAIYRETGAWSHPYPDLRIAFHTGIKIGGHYTYGGTRFFNNSDMATELMSIGNGDNLVRVAYGLNVNDNVVIGTTQTSANLYVHGTLKSKEVKVEATVQVPDYVFEKSYHLQPLSEVEKYITENKHLSEIPSAKEIEKEGINIGDMQLGLLKKIEELTLYMIQQNKESVELRKALEIQSKRAEQQEQRIQEQQKLIEEVQKQIKK